MRFFPLFILLSSFVLFSCNSSKKTTEKVESNKVDFQQLKLLTVGLDSIQRDYFELDSLKIIGDLLHAYVSYDGGCGEVVFDLYYTNRVMESFPPQTVLYLSFIDNDPCRSIESKTKIFNLEPFDHFAKNGGIWLRIAGFDNKVLFKYN